MLTRKRLFNYLENTNKAKFTYNRNHTRIKANGSVIDFWEDGTITRGDTDLRYCTNMSLKDAAHVLGYKE